MTRSYSEKCFLCNTKTMIDWAKPGARIDLEKEKLQDGEDSNEDFIILCHNCCKAKNFYKEECLNCSEFIICSSSNEEGGGYSWVKDLKGI